MSIVCPKTQRAFNALILVFASLFISSTYSNAQTYPTGFQQVLVANGISNPTVMEFCTRWSFVCCSASRSIENNREWSAACYTCDHTKCKFIWRKRFAWIAFDPNFTTNHFIYLYYTLSSASNNRISRFTMSGNTIVAGSESVVLNLDPLSSATNHNGGTIQFGPDGKIVCRYWGKCKLC
jgi:glucose/arabinose dehydrogenase